MSVQELMAIHQLAVELFKSSALQWNEVNSQWHANGTVDNSPFTTNLDFAEEDTCI